MPEYNDTIIDSIIEYVLESEQAASAECAALGCYDVTPNAVEAFGLHEAIETQVAGAFAERR